MALQRTTSANGENVHIKVMQNKLLSLDVQMLCSLNASFKQLAVYLWDLGWIHFMQSRFPTKHQHSESSYHVVHSQIYQPIRKFVVAASDVTLPNQKNVAGYHAARVTNFCHMTVTPMETVTRNKNCSWIWKESLYRLCFGTKCHRLSSRNFLTREMLFPRHLRDAVKTTQLSGKLVFGFWFCTDLFI